MAQQRWIALGNGGATNLSVTCNQGFRLRGPLEGVGRCVAWGLCRGYTIPRWICGGGLCVPHATPLMSVACVRGGTSNGAAVLGVGRQAEPGCPVPRCKATWEDSATPRIPCRYFKECELGRVRRQCCPHVGQSVRCAWVGWCVLSRCCVCVPRLCAEGLVSHANNSVR